MCSTASDHNSYAHSIFLEVEIHSVLFKVQTNIVACLLLLLLLREIPSVFEFLVTIHVLFNQLITQHCSWTFQKLPLGRTATLAQTNVFAAELMKSMKSPRVASWCSSDRDCSRRWNIWTCWSLDWGFWNKFIYKV